MAKSLDSKNRSEELFGSIKNQGSSKGGDRRQSFRNPYLEPEEIVGEECSQLLVKHYNNTLQEDKKG